MQNVSSNYLLNHRVEDLLFHYYFTFNIFNLRWQPLVLPVHRIRKAKTIGTKALKCSRNHQWKKSASIKVRIVQCGHFVAPCFSPVLQRNIVVYYTRSHSSYLVKRHISGIINRSHDFKNCIYKTKYLWWNVREWKKFRQKCSKVVTGLLQILYSLAFPWHSFPPRFGLKIINLLFLILPYEGCLTVQWLFFYGTHLICFITRCFFPK